MYLCIYVSVHPGMYGSIDIISIMLHGFQDTSRYNFTLCKSFVTSTNHDAECSADGDVEIPAPPLAPLPSPVR